MLSIIIPAYNASKKINRCLDSIKDQNIEELEIIVINDGSVDDTLNKVKYYASLNSSLNIKVIHQNNSGAAVSRNKGIEIAKGEYIFFVDADDFLVPNSLQKIIDIINKRKPDIIYFDYFRYYINNNYTYIKNHDEMFLNINDDLIVHSTAPWLMIIKKELIDRYNFRFPNISAYEDYASLPFLGSVAQNIVYYNKPIYVYSQEDYSIMRVKSKKFDKKYLLIIDATNNLIQLFRNDYISKQALEYTIMRELVINGCQRIDCCEDENRKEIINAQRKICDYFIHYFPNWKNNQYLKKSKFSFKLLFYLTINKLYKIKHFIIFLSKQKNKIRCYKSEEIK